MKKTQKKIKILNDSFNNNNCIIPNNTQIVINNSNDNNNIINIENSEKDDNLTFNYLKKLKIFRDELLYNEFSQFGTNNNENIENNKEEIENNFEKENENTFTEHRFRKNSNISYVSNLYDDNVIKQNKGDCMSEIGLFN